MSRTDIGVVFDVDGTLVDSERDGHRVAFNAAFEQFGLAYRWSVEEYADLLAVTGGQRRIAGYLAQLGCADEELASTLHQAKTEIFRQLAIDGEIAPRPGMVDLIDELKDASVAVHVATTGSGAWVFPLLDKAFGAGVFDVVVTGDDVARLKPDPEAYVLAIERVPQRRLVAVEDSTNGVRAAVAAGLPVVAVRNDYTRDHDLDGAALVVDDPQELNADSLLGRGCWV